MHYLELKILTTPEPIEIIHREKKVSLLENKIQTIKVISKLN